MNTFRQWTRTRNCNAWGSSIYSTVRPKVEQLTDIGRDDVCIGSESDLSEIFYNYRSLQPEGLHWQWQTLSETVRHLWSNSKCSVKIVPSTSFVTVLRSSSSRTFRMCRDLWGNKTGIMPDPHDQQNVQHCGWPTTVWQEMSRDITTTLPNCLPGDRSTGIFRLPHYWPSPPTVIPGCSGLFVLWKRQHYTFVTIVFHNWIISHGISLYLFANDGPQFVAKPFVDLLLHLKIIQLTTTAYRSEINAQAGCYNKDSYRIIVALRIGPSKDWCQCV